MMEYKGYVAGRIDFDPDHKSFSGTVTGLRDVIHFEGRTTTELERAFRQSVGSYLELCSGNRWARKVSRSKNAGSSAL